MTKVLTPLTTPPMKPPPEETRPVPRARAYSSTLRERLSQSMSTPASHSWIMGRYSVRDSERPFSCFCSRSKAAGISWMMDITASAMPGPITSPARASTPSTATRVSTRARGRRIFAPLRLFFSRCRSMARMGTFSTKARAPPSRNGARMPSSQPAAPSTTSRCCRAQ